MSFLHPYLEEIITGIIALLNGGAVIGVLLSRRREPSATLAWLFFLFLAPVVGLIAYHILGRTRMNRAIKQFTAAEQRVSTLLARHQVLRKIGDVCCQDELDARSRSMLNLGASLSSTPASRGNRVVLLADAARTYAEMKRAITAARHHIHVEFYIIQNDVTGKALRQLLVEQAERGIEVRVLVDGMGSIGLPSDFWIELLRAGGKTDVFNPVRFRRFRLTRRDRVDFRNHRKIIVVDGRTAFTGGINVGKEYLGLDPEIGHWRDTHLRIDGPAALSIQHAFAQDWVTATGEELDSEHFFPDLVADEEPGNCIVHVLDSGPDHRWQSMSLIHQHAIALAQTRVWITNPYFIPGKSVMDALVAAALRGVDVRLLLPRKSDSRLVSSASKSYYPELLRAGIKIYEYQSGFIHAKTMLVDDWMGTVGSANMDLRSFKLNFELNAFVYTEEFPLRLAEQYLTDLASAELVSVDAALRISAPKRLVRSVARLMSPLL